MLQWAADGCRGETDSLGVPCVCQGHTDASYARVDGAAPWTCRREGQYISCVSIYALRNDKCADPVRRRPTRRRLDVKAKASVIVMYTN